MTRSKPIEISSSDLPEGWCVSSIGEISLYIQRGKSPVYTEKSDLPVVNQKCVRWDGIDRDHLKFIHPDQFDKWSSERFLVNGDILWNSTGTGTIGRAALVQLSNDERIVADSHITIVRPSTNVTAKYVHYWIMSSAVQNSIGVIQSGSTNQVELSKSAVESTPIPLAPLEQQKLIVSKIEELFSHIDAGIEGLKQTKTKLQQYRQSVLKDAVTGKLTEKWREQNAGKLDPADKLLERILTERRENWEQEQLKAFATKGSLPKGDGWKEKYKVPPVADVSLLPELPTQWVWSTITQLGELNRGKSKHRPRNDPVLYGGSYPFIQTGDVRAADGVLKTYTQTYSEKGLAQSRLWPKGTLCITIAANIAETAILGIDACFPDSIVGFIPHDKLVSVEYIEFFFRTAKQNLDRYAPATAQKNINLEILKSVAVPLMSVAEQQALVLAVSEKLDAANRAENLINSKIKYSAALKASILTKAFSGGLVPNESAQSALELLEKINAEKQQLVKEAKGKPKKEKKVTKGRKSLESVLKTIKEPVSPEELMQLAEFSLEEVEEFYIELAMLSDRLEKVTPTKEQLKSWPYEKDASLKLKLKD
ncbi:restriction endonuclease subunit S [Alkalimonas sp. NCh-2]|uniref:restriction endonuclease subunit S n=1 Tax=Alkalimonas sp. NCh-2 TaxID=3144846 RepID=UPI0031F6D819